MEDGYRLVSYADAQGRPRAGVLANGRVIAAEDILGRSGSVIDILRDWDATHPRLAQASASGSGIPLTDAKLLAPILYPGAFFCAGANYWDHLQEMAEIARR